ncbi:MAG: hypothetical protein WKF75_01055 [Singulisphaera sp.]
MARKDTMLRLHARLVARRDALRKALNGDLEMLRDFTAVDVVGDQVDAAVDTANDEISSQLAEMRAGNSRRLSMPASGWSRASTAVASSAACKIAEARSTRCHTSILASTVSE